MSQEIYDPDMIDRPAASDTAYKGMGPDPYAEKNEPAAPPAKTDGVLKRMWRAVRGSHLRMLFGAALGLFGLYTGWCLVSFLSNGAADQSVVLNNAAAEVARAETAMIKNTGGSLGAAWANMLFNQGVGLASFLLPLWMILIGLGLVGVRKIKFFATTFTCLLLAIAVALPLGYVSLGSSSHMLLGGNYGKYVTMFLRNFVGDMGTILIYALVIFALILLWYQTILKALRRARKLLKRRPANPVDDHSDALTEGQASGFSDDGTDVPSAVTEMPLDTTTEPIEMQPADAADDDDKPARRPRERKPKDEVTSEIREADSVEKADRITVQPYDPTGDLPDYKFPKPSLMNEVPPRRITTDRAEQESNKQRIIATLRNYDIEIKHIEATVGPTVTLFEIVPAAGVRISKIKNLEDDIALSLAALGIRIIAPIPGKGTIGIEVPNRNPEIVPMRMVIESKEYQDTKCELPIAMGCTISNKVFVKDLAKMPHLLVAGATGQGKSVGLNAIITSLLYKKHPAELKFVLVDPKMVEFSLYSKLERHYMAELPDQEEPIITEADKVQNTLNSLTIEMDNRYMLLKDAQVRSIKEYNAKFINRQLSPADGHRYLPYIVVIIDEFSDLIMQAGKNIEMPIARIAQKARAVGMHMIIATQRPTTTVITGNIKANFPGRVAFRVSQMIDSKTILDCSGAQHLIGRGDMLFLDGGKMERVQCAFIDTPEVERICEYIYSQPGYAHPYELPEFVGDIEEGSAAAENLADRDPLFEEAARFIIQGETASTSSLQRRYSIGYNRAGKIMDQMEAAGVVGPALGGKPRKVLLDIVGLEQILGS